MHPPLVYIYMVMEVPSQQITNTSQPGRIKWRINEYKRITSHLLCFGNRSINVICHSAPTSANPASSAEITAETPIGRGFTTHCFVPCTFISLTLCSREKKSYSGLNINKLPQRETTSKRLYTPFPELELWMAPETTG